LAGYICRSVGWDHVDNVMGLGWVEEIGPVYKSEVEYGDRELCVVPARQQPATLESV